MRIRLVVTVPLPEGESKEYDTVFQQDEIVIGRRPGCDITIPTPEVSDEHARIRWHQGEYVIVDLGSDSGTRLDGSPLTAEEPATLSDGAEIGVGGCSIRVTLESGELSSAIQEKTQQVAMQMVREVLGALGGGGPCPHVEIINDEEQGQKAELPEVGSEIVLGREKECRLRLSHWSVSRRHARLWRTKQGVKVEDLGSKNGVMLNEEVITEPKLLRDGDIVFVGHTQVRFHDPGDTLTDQLLDLPDPVALDMKTSVIDLGDKTQKPQAPAAKKKAGEEEAPAEDEAPAKKKSKKQKKAPAPPPAAVEEGAPVLPEDDMGGGLGDWLFVIIGVLVILGAAAAAVILFVL